MMRLLERAANLEGWPLFVWTVADGLKRVPRTDVVTQTYEFQDALRHIDKTPQNGVYVLIDAQPYFDDPVNVRLVKEIAQEYQKTARTLIFIGAKLDLPADLSRMSARFNLPLPDVAEIREIFKEEAQLWQRTEGHGPLKGDQQAVELIVQYLAGMQVAVSSVNWGLNLNPSPVKNATDLLRSLTGRFTKILVLMRFPFDIAGQPPLSACTMDISSVSASAMSSVRASSPFTNTRI